jgi:hypothetical protein
VPRRIGAVATDSSQANPLQMGPQLKLSQLASSCASDYGRTVNCPPGLFGAEEATVLLPRHGSPSFFYMTSKWHCARAP